MPRFSDIVYYYADANINFPVHSFEVNPGRFLSGCWLLWWSGHVFICFRGRSLVNVGHFIVFLVNICIVGPWLILLLYERCPDRGMCVGQYYPLSNYQAERVDLLSIWIRDMYV